MEYTSYTTDDPNIIKRTLQRRRLDDALLGIRRHVESPKVVLDYGGGAGLLSLACVQAFPGVEAICYEPSETIRKEAEARADVAGFRVVGTTDEVADGTVSAITCCEVFEHLPEAETRAALRDMRRMLRPGGRLVLGIPNEVWAVGVLKGLFRLARRGPGEYDTSIANILACGIGRPPKDRPVADLDGLRFIFPHTGFDFRTTPGVLREEGFRIVGRYGSPFRPMPSGVNSEVYLVCEKTED